jgi:methionyl-tRNA formyltransferase
MPLRILFFGTPAFAVPTLDALIASEHHLVAVVTQPDRPRGRGQKVLPPPVKVRALEAGVPVLQPEKIRQPEILQSLADLAPDLGVVAAYGKILPQALLDIPRLGMINVHASLLPRWRGAAPVHRAVIAGDTTTGVTIMRVVLALDAGPMLDAVTLDIGPDETSAELEPRLASAGAAALARTVERLAHGAIAEASQDEAHVTYAARLERRESQVDWHRPAAIVHNQIRGLQPWPLAGALLQGRRVSFLRSTLAPPTVTPGAPGTIVAADASGLVVATDSGAVQITVIQPEGRPPMSVRDFLNGRSVSPGERFDPLTQS